MPPEAPPQTRYVNNGGVHVAYQVVGDGPIDLVFVMGWITHLDYFWLQPSFARFLRRLASFSRLILVDKRGQGLSDRGGPVPTLEERSDDLRAVLDAVGSTRAAIMGHSEGGSLSILFAATYPERTTKLVLAGTAPRWHWAPDWPWARTEREIQDFYQRLEQGWGTVEWARGDVQVRAPGVADDLEFVRWWATYLRMGASPGTAIAVTEMVAWSDVSPVLPSIHVPTLIVHRSGDRVARVEAARYMAQQIPGASYLELPGDDHLVFVGNHDEILQPVEEFLGATPLNVEPDAMLGTMLSMEICNSAQLVARLGDYGWQSVRRDYFEIVRRALATHRGRDLSHESQPLIALFDGPSRAIRCGQAILEEGARLGLRQRAGLHTGECEIINGQPTGVPLRLAASIMSNAAEGEMLVSSTVRDLVTGSGIVFADRAESPTITGFGGSWRLYRIEGPAGVETGGVQPLRAAPSSIARERWDPLTRREREVVGLLARGQTNREIADTLVISERTVENHVSNVLGKLGMGTRAQVAIWALRTDTANEPISA